MITKAEIIERTREIKLADARALLGDDYVKAYNRGYAGYTRGTDSDRYLGEAIAFAGWEAGYCGTKWNDDYTQDALLAALAKQEIRAEHDAKADAAIAQAQSEAIAQAEHDAAGPDHATWCAGRSAHLVVLPELDDASRTVEVVSAEGIAWEATGRASQVALWLGNATEHDREALRTLARQVARTGRALRIEFGSVMPFYMGATEYGGRTLYRIFVPPITSQVAAVVLGPMHFHPVHVSKIVSGDVIDLQRAATGETYYAALTESVRDNPGPRLTPAGWHVNFAGGGSWLVGHDTELRIANRADAVTRARLAELGL